MICTGQVVANRNDKQQCEHYINSRVLPHNEKAMKVQAMFS